MKKYLSTLKDRPHQHKRRFAMLTSGVVTLSIFAIWSVVKFSAEPIVAVKDTKGPVDLAAAIESTGGLSEIVEDLKTTWSSITDNE